MHGAIAEAGIQLSSMQSCVYILASHRHGTMYIGVTSNLVCRVYKHRNQCINGFSSKYDVFNLVYFECCSDIRSAIQREKQLKKWNRQWKIELIEKTNPEWDDLYPTLL